MERSTSTQVVVDVEKEGMESLSLQDEEGLFLSFTLSPQCLHKLLFLEHLLSVWEGCLKRCLRKRSRR